MKGPAWLDTAIFYGVYPQSFFDNNGDGIGDLQGLIEKLAYIEELGCNAIWLNPCYESPFRDAGYDISNYYNTASRYGSNADMKRLFREAKRRGIRICLDLVVGHTSIDHPWFQESCKAEANKYSNWYVWTDTWLSFSNTKDLRLVSGGVDRNGCYIVNFFSSMPALNYGFAKPDPNQPWQLPTDHPDVLALREEVKNIMRFWLDLGASGFRCDMAASLVKNDPGQKATSVVWRDIRAMLDKEYPEAVLISEWGNPPSAIRAGFHMDFLSIHEDPADTSLFRAEKERNILSEMLELATGSFFDKKGEGDISIFLNSYEDFYRKTKRHGHISIPTGNHDFGRLSTGRSHKELELIFAFLMTMPGVPLVYYGEEIGMRYRKGLVSKEGGYVRTGARTPMQWSKERNAGFSKAAAKDLYLPVETKKRYPNVATQKATPNSLLNQVQRLIELRKETPALCAEGAFKVVYAKPKRYPLVYLRERGGQKVLVALNPSKEPVSVRFRLNSGAKSGELLMGRGVTLGRGKTKWSLEMDGISYGVFRV
jgi:maltose alpha-D-glucosyltransferase/alpha-amylase